MSSLPTKFLSIDEEGYALQGEVRWTDELLGHELLSNLQKSETGALISKIQGQDVLIEAFDEPLIARHVEFRDKDWWLLAPYGFEARFELSSLGLDEWDRFHGRTSAGIPFVFSRPAQNDFFNLLEAFDDESIRFQGRDWQIPSIYVPLEDIQDSRWWTRIYHEEKTPGWDLGAPAEALKDMLPRLKLPKSRVLVPGCGEGHDAALFARDGHLVTAVDFSEEALQRAKSHYGHLSNLEFRQADLFEMGSEFDGQFDVIFEHTFYCAIPPRRRQELVANWTRWLSPGGHLMGVFFAMDKPVGPPYGGSEWELRRRLQKSYRFLFWGRWRQSLPRRQGKELFIYATKM